MKKYSIQLRGWDFDRWEVIEAENAEKAKGIYIKKSLRNFSDAYPKKFFFSSTCMQKCK